jgi:hypothetical protein
MIILEVLFMSPVDIVIFLFFILVTVKAALSCIDYWKGSEEEQMPVSMPEANKTRASLSRTVRTGIPSSVRVTPIKRIETPVIVSESENYSFHLKDKGAA